MSEMMSELQKRSVVELVDELNVAIQKLTLVSNSETLVTLNKKLLELANLVAKSEQIIETSQQDRENVNSFIQEFKEAVEDFKIQVDNINLSKLDDFCTILGKLPKQLEAQIEKISQTIEQSSNHVDNLVGSLKLTRWISGLSCFAMVVCGVLLWFYGFLPLKDKQQEVVESIGEKSERFQNLLLQRQIDLEHIKKIEALLNQKQKDFGEAIDFIKYLNNYDENTLLINKGRFDNYRNKRNQ